MNSSEIVKKKSKLQIRDMIQLFVLICMLIGLVLAIQNIKSNVISLCIISFMGLFCLIAFLSAIVEFTKYIILKSSEFELTKDKENVIWLIGLAAYIVCSSLASDDVGNYLNYSTSLLKVYQADFLMMFLLVFWYFTICFFSAVFFLLSVHKVILILKRFLPERVSKKKNEKKDLKKLDSFTFSKKVLNIIESEPVSIKKLLLNVLWGASVIIDSGIMIVMGIIEMIAETISATILIIPMKLLNKAKKLINLMQRNQGRVIILSSRISLVSSLFIVYVINSYQNVISEAGSGVYEFLCSVFIIPFLVTQLNEIRKNENDE